jgi:hypothetical protein
LPETTAFFVELYPESGNDTTPPPVELTIIAMFLPEDASPFPYDELVL